ncbi:MAG: tetratricopeptide repeat protein, partial [Flavobacteriales bacterium]|nr:tetratricopeptide repeat protein [Flavobacteriales bacterium]
KECMDEFTQSAKFFKESSSFIEQGMVIMNMGVIFSDQGNIERAKNKYLESEQIFLGSGSRDYLSGVYINLAGVYEKSDDLDSSLIYYDKGLQLAIETENSSHIGIAYQNIGIIEERNGSLLPAANNLEKALTIFTTIGDARLIAEAHYALSGIYGQLSQYLKAFNHLELAKSAALELGHVELKINVYDRYIELLSAQKGLDVIYEMHTLQLSLLDSLRSDENFKVVEELNVQYHLNDKEDSIRYQGIEIANQQEINAQITTINEQRGTLLWISILGVALLLTLAIFLLKSRKKIRLKNHENELLLGEIHHRVKNNLQVISSLLSLQEKSMTDESAIKAIREGKERVKSMGLIHNMLYQNDNFSGIEMKDYIHKLVHGLMDSFGIPKSELELDTNFDSIKLDVDSAIPVGLIINELVINSFKYAYHKSDQPKMAVKLALISDQLVLEVRDNGNGKEASLRSSNSFGFKLVNSLVRQLSGELSLDDKNGLSYKILINDFKLA